MDNGLSLLHRRRAAFTKRRQPSRGYPAHIKGTAYHEAGHAIAALKMERFVHRLAVDHNNPGRGVTWYNSAKSNPYNIESSPGKALLAWQYTYDTTLNDIFILLAGPMAESKLLARPLRQLGNKRDLDTCMELACRLDERAKTARKWTDIPHIQKAELLNHMRRRTRAWVNGKKTWNAISVVATALINNTWVENESLSDLVGQSLCFESRQLQLTI
ncbi:MAG TPA: hypothetical protein EYP91_22320 [Gammaproteobacteria bacterium]|nr:hypothetical protein [Gammaproteobacteria bacterium]